MSRKDSAASGHRIEITADLDRHAAEALLLEIRRLARRHGVDIKEFCIEKVADEP